MAGKVTKFQKLQKVKKQHCAGKATSADVTAAAKAYTTDAVTKGRTKAQAEASANRVIKSGCGMGKLAKPKKKTAVTKKSK